MQLCLMVSSPSLVLGGGPSARPLQSHRAALALSCGILHHSSFGHSSTNDCCRAWHDKLLTQRAWAHRSQTAQLRQASQLFASAGNYERAAGLLTELTKGDPADDTLWQNLVRS